MLSTASFKSNILLRNYSTFGIGGAARYLIEVRSVEAMREALLYCASERLPYLIIGKGSNSLFDDKGFDGLAIVNKIDFFNEIAPGQFHVGAGYSFSLLGSKTAREGWSGLEFASGIPGTVGGAVFMNAGANGSETCNSLASVDFIDEKGSPVTLQKTELSFGYRHSSFQSIRGAIVGATFLLTRSETARKKQLDIIDYRKKTQPYSDKSVGCIFRNPVCGHAGALIEQCGLKGRAIGGAEVSEVHANFIVNKGNATSKDVLELIQLIKEQVKEKTGIELESEVRVL
jgi:UDP-N-acetylmuramate dehydrogenase